MTKGVYVSPVTYENRDNLGNVDCQFLVNFSGGPSSDPTTLTLTSITAFNAQGSGLTEIQVTRSDGAIFTFPLPTNGSKVTVNVTDPQGLPTTISCYHASVTQAQINSAGFFVLSDIAGYTVF